MNGSTAPGFDSWTTDLAILEFTLDAVAADPSAESLEAAADFCRARCTAISRVMNPYIAAFIDGRADFSVWKAALCRHVLRIGAAKDACAAGTLRDSLERLYMAAGFYVVHFEAGARAAQATVSSLLQKLGVSGVIS